MSKLVVAYIVENDEDVFPLSFDSVKDVADHIVVVDGNHYSEPYKENCEQGWQYTNMYKSKCSLISNPYPHEELGANGKQRNVYLKHLKKHFLGDWCLVLDADESVNNLQQLKDDLDHFEKQEAVFVHPRMIHFIKDLAHEDSTSKYHWCIGRIFKIRDDLHYPEVEHPILQCDDKSAFCMYYNKIILYHLGYCREIFGLRKKYLNHLQKSNIHSKSFLHHWYYAHITGQYPTTNFDIETLPNVLKDYFMPSNIMNVHYFKDRMGLEDKHMLEALLWNEYFKPKRSLEVGCGAGQRSWVLKKMGVDALGFDISEYIIGASPFNSGNLSQNDVCMFDYSLGDFDFVFTYDLLEHVKYEDLDEALRNIKQYGTKNFLFSIPFLGDANLEKDKTHIIKESKEWWEKKISGVGIKIVETPKHFMFSEQLIIGEIK